MVQLVEALRYKPEGRLFASPWCYWDFSLTKSFRPHSGPGADSPSIRNEYHQEYFLGGKGGLCVWLETSPPSFADCGQIWEPQASGTLRACPGLKWNCCTFLHVHDNVVANPLVFLSVQSCLYGL